MKKLRGIAMISALCIITSTMTGCSYKDFEDKFLSGAKKLFSTEKKSEEKDNNSNDNAKNDGVDVGKSSEKLEESTKNIIKDNAVCEMGSVITLDLLDEEVKYITEYTINSTNIYSSLEESNIDKSLILNSKNENADKILGNGKKLLIANVTIKNVDREDDIYISEIGLNYIEKNRKIESGEVIPEIEYCSSPGPKKDGQWKNYYKCSLEKGESKSVEIGWIIDTNKFDLDKLYIDIGTQTSYEYQKFVKLEIGENKK